MKSYKNKYFPKKRLYIIMYKKLFSQVHCFDTQGKSLSFLELFEAKILAYNFIILKYILRLQLSSLYVIALLGKAYLKNCVEGNFFVSNMILFQ